MSRLVKSNERGSSNLKFLLVMAIIGGVAFIGYKFVPVVYQSYLFKDLMQHNVDVAATQGYQPDWVRTQLVKSLPEYNIPPTAVINTTSRDNRVEATVQFTQPIEFPGYTYEYEFKQTVRSTAFLTFK